MRLPFCSLKARSCGMSAPHLCQGITVADAIRVPLASGLSRAVDVADWSPRPTLRVFPDSKVIDRPVSTVDSLSGGRSRDSSTRS